MKHISFLRSNPQRLHPRKTGRSLFQLPAQAPRSRPRSLGSLLTPPGFHTFPQPRLLRALVVPSVAEAMEMCKNLHRLGSPSEGNPARPRPHRLRLHLVPCCHCAKHLMPEAPMQDCPPAIVSRDARRIGRCSASIRSRLNVPKTPGILVSSSDSALLPEPH